MASKRDNMWKVTSGNCTQSDITACQMGQEIASSWMIRQTSSFELLLKILRLFRQRNDKKTEEYEIYRKLCFDVLCDVYLDNQGSPCFLARLFSGAQQVKKNSPCLGFTLRSPPSPLLPVHHQTEAP